MTTKLENDVFVIGDVHGHFDRLVALLEQEGLIEAEHDDLPLGYARIRPDVNIVQLGDLGHFGIGASPTADLMCYQLAENLIDVVLWGNHDRAVIDSWHAFGGYDPPIPATKKIMKDMRESGKLRLADVAHDFLLTHAGLHKSFKHNDVPEDWKHDPISFAEAMNTFDTTSINEKPTGAEVALQAIRDAISPWRGGRHPVGGILWRDAGEKLHDEFQQIFGHTAKDKTRTYHGDHGPSYCIDVGTKTNGRLAGIWLPSQTIVEVACPVNDFSHIVDAQS